MGKAGTIIRNTRAPSPVEAINLGITGSDEEVLVIGQTTSTEQEYTLVSTASLRTNPLLPRSTPQQPKDIVQLSLDEDDDTFYDAVGPPTCEPPSPTSKISNAWKAQREPIDVAPDAATLDDEDVFYDAVATGLNQTVPSPVQRISCKTRLETPSRPTARSKPIRGSYSPELPPLPPIEVTPNTRAPSTRSPPRQGRWLVATLSTNNPIPASNSNSARRKALVIGMSYSKSKRPLKYGTKDAIEFGQSLITELGFRERDIVFIVDEPPADRMSPQAAGPGLKQNRVAKQNRNHLSPQEPQWQKPIWFHDGKLYVYPTRSNIIEGFRSLVKGAKEGDHLIFHISSHCGLIDDNGPYLIPANVKKCEDIKVENMISREDILNELLLKVPKGCRLDIFADTCYSSALFNLQYCVARMHQTKHVSVTVVPSQSPAATNLSTNVKLPLLPAYEHESTCSSLHGLQPTTQIKQDLGLVKDIPDPVCASVVRMPEPISADQVQATLPPAQLSANTAWTPSWTTKEDGTVPTTGLVPKPPPTMASTGWVPNISAWMSAEDPTALVPADESVEVRQPMNSHASCVRENVDDVLRPPDLFEKKREAGFDRLEGHVTVWAAAGGNQGAFEASEPAGHGILTNVLCQALKTCKEITNRELWQHLRKALESENRDRSLRDQLKKERPDPRARVQHAELWTSHSENPHSANLFLDGQAFYSVLVADAQPQVAVTAAT